MASIWSSIMAGGCTRRTAGEIAQQLEHKGFTIDRRKLQLEEPLRQLGEFHVPVKLHREVTAHVKVTVKAEDAEA